MGSHGRQPTVERCLIGPDSIIKAVSQDDSSGADKGDNFQQPIYRHRIPSTLPSPPPPQIKGTTTAGTASATAKGNRTTTDHSLQVEATKLLWLALGNWATLFQRRTVQRILLTFVFSGMLATAAFYRGFAYTPPKDVVIYCGIYSLWVTMCLPWLLLNLDGKAIGLIAGVFLRLFAADIGVLGYAAWRGDSYIMQRGLRLKPVMESSLSWLSEAGYSLRFAVIVASLAASVAKLAIDATFIPLFKSQYKEPEKDPGNALTGNNVNAPKEDCGLSRNKTFKTRPQRRKNCFFRSVIKERDAAACLDDDENIFSRSLNKKNLPHLRRKLAHNANLDREDQQQVHSPLSTKDAFIGYKGHGQTPSPATAASGKRSPNQRKFAGYASSPGTSKEGRNYSRLGRGRRGSSREGSFDLKPWKKTNPTIFSPAKSWEKSSNIPMGFPGGSFLTRAGDNISFNKKIGLDESSSTQNSEFGIPLADNTRKRIGRGGGGGGERRKRKGGGREREGGEVEELQQVEEDGEGAGEEDVKGGGVRGKAGKARYYNQAESKMCHGPQPQRFVKSGSYYERELMKRRLTKTFANANTLMD